MHSQVLLAFGLFLSLIGSAYSDPPTVHPLQQPLRKSIFEKLTSDQYFKDGSCREFADYNLIQNGLPKLGDLGPVRGMRLSTDRQNESASPPIFSDSVEKSEKPYSSYKFSATGNHDQWQAIVEREMEIPNSKNDHRHLKTRTTYHFQILNYDNRGSCAVSSFDFQAGIQGDPEPIKRVMDLNSCMDLFIQGVPGAKELSWAEIKTLRILKEDCSMSMHYSLDAKKILAKPTN